MKIKFKPLSELAVIPQKAYDKDFCYDLVAVSEEEIAPNVWKYGFGFGLQIERGLEEIFVDKERNMAQCMDMSMCPVNISIDIRPRSSVWKTGMVLSNCVGTVDEGYTNEISAVFYHVNKELPRYKVGDKIAQMVCLRYPTVELIETTELSETERGEGGFGSTDKKQ